ncbi:hypothetical protein [Sulfuricurvum sp.]|uniref:hypothetical protein n=1 Tax=Sulfuricurvum sp. TaxID=2025608 RepID=UPI003569D305
MPRIKIFDKRSTCTFRTTKKDQENLAKAIEYFETKSGKNISKNVAINSSLEFIAGLQDTATRQSHHSKNPTRGESKRNGSVDSTEPLVKRKNGNESGNECTEANNLGMNQTDRG